MNTSSDLFRHLLSQFIRFTDEEWQLLLPHLSEKQIIKGNCMICEGEYGHELAYIIEGTMRHYYIRHGEERTTYFYFENMLVGPYISCINSKPSQITIEALSDTKLLIFPYSALVELFNKNKSWERFGRLLAEYLALGLEDRMVDLLTLSPEERYAKLLQSNKQRILERIPQHYIANYLGITPVSLSRIRNRLLKK